jgi:hypothetical protein
MPRPRLEPDTSYKLGAFLLGHLSPCLRTKEVFRILFSSSCIHCPTDHFIKNCIPTILKTKLLLSPERYFYIYEHFIITLIINRSSYFRDLIFHPADNQVWHVGRVSSVEKHWPIRRKWNKKCKVIPVTGREDAWVVRRQGSHIFLDNLLIDGGEVFSLTRRPPFTLQVDSW